MKPGQPAPVSAPDYYTRLREQPQKKAAVLKRVTGSRAREEEAQNATLVRFFVSVIIMKYEKFKSVILYLIDIRL